MSWLRMVLCVLVVLAVFSCDDISAQSADRLQLLKEEYKEEIKRLGDRGDPTNPFENLDEDREQRRRPTNPFDTSRDVTHTSHPKHEVFLQYRAAVIEEAFEIAEENPASQAASESLAWIVSLGGNESKDAIKLLVSKCRTSHHLAEALSQQWGESNLETVLNDSPHREVQGIATYLLAVHNLRGDEKKALSFYERVETDFADVQYRGKTLLEHVKRPLDQLRLFGIGAEPPEFVGESPDGEEIKLSDFRGRVVLLHFWGDWCPPCRAMYAQLNELQKDHAEKGFSVLGVSTDQEIERVRKLQEDGDIIWPTICDSPRGVGEISKAWQIRAFPTIFLIDADGKIREKNLRGEKLIQAVEKLVEELDQ